MRPEVVGNTSIGHYLTDGIAVGHRPHGAVFGNLLHGKAGHPLFGRAGQDGVAALHGGGGQPRFQAESLGYLAGDPQVRFRLEQRVDHLLLDDYLAVAALHIAEGLVVLEARGGGQHVVGPFCALGEVGVDAHHEVQGIHPLGEVVHGRYMLGHEVAAEDGAMDVVLLEGHVVEAQGGGGHGPVLREGPAAQRCAVAVVRGTHVNPHAGAGLADVAGDGSEDSGGVAGDVGIGHLVVATPA